MIFIDQFTFLTLSIIFSTNNTSFIQMILFWGWKPYSQPQIIQPTQPLRSFTTNRSAPNPRFTNLVEFVLRIGLVYEVR